MIKVQELKGFKSLKALNAFHALLLGLKMLPAYMSETYEEFFAKVDQLPQDKQESLLREAAMFVELQKDEVEALASFALDPNGVPYSSENLKSLGPDKLIEIIVAVCMKIAEIKITLVTDSEKKN